MFKYVLILALLLCGCQDTVSVPSRDPQTPKVCKNEDCPYDDEPEVNEE